MLESSCSRFHLHTSRPTLAEHPSHPGLYLRWVRPQSHRKTRSKQYGEATPLVHLPLILIYQLTTLHRRLSIPLLVPFDIQSDQSRLPKAQHSISDIYLQSIHISLSGPPPFRTNPLHIRAHPATARPMFLRSLAFRQRRWL